MKKDRSNKEKIEEYLDEGLEWIRKLYEQNEYKYAGDMVDIYDSYGNFYDSFLQTEQWLKAEEYYRKSIELCENLYKRNPEKYGERLMRAKNNFGGYCQEHGQLEKAAQYLEEAYDLAERLHIHNPEKYDRLVECLNLGKSLNKKGDPRAIEYLKKCLEIIENADEKKKEYDNELASVYHNMAACQSMTGEMKADYMKKVIEITEKMYQKNPERYGLYLASCYDDMAVIYNDMPGMYGLVIDYLHKSDLLIPKRMEDVNIERDGLRLAQIYSNLAILYYLPKDIKYAMEYIEKAINIAESLEQLDANKFGPYLIDFYTHLANFYKRISKKKVLPCYMKALDIAERLQTVNDEVYFIKSAEIYYEFFEFYIDKYDNQEILNYRTQYIEILQKIDDLGVEKHNEYLIRGYYIIGRSYEEQGDNLLMEQYYDKCWHLLKNMDELVTEYVDFTDINNDLSKYYHEKKKFENGETKKEKTELKEKSGLFRKFAK